MNSDKVKNVVKDSYAQIATGDKSCCCASKQISQEIGYSSDDMDSLPEANMGLGCGNPTALGKIKPKDIVLDLGCGAGFDTFLAAKQAGDSGKVIGVDMTQEMINKAKANTKKYNYKNVEFKIGDIENLPLEDSVIDIIISNCVINLAPDKLKVFQEAYRVLKSNGRMYVSDIVLLEELSAEQKNNEELLAGCVAGALLKNDYLDIIKQAGFEANVQKENQDISKQQYQGVPLESLTIELVKNL